MLKDDSPNAPVDSAQNFTVGVGKSVVLKPQSPAMTAAACVGGFLVPGLGHLLLGRWIRGHSAAGIRNPHVHPGPGDAWRLVVTAGIRAN